jgi:hypothetical protein
VLFRREEPGPYLADTKLGPHGTSHGFVVASRHHDPRDPRGAEGRHVFPRAGPGLVRDRHYADGALFG